jgi:hypothetical protein
LHQKPLCKVLGQVQKEAPASFSFLNPIMKKKDIRTKIENALTLALFELQFSPSKKVKKGIAEFSKNLSARLKDEWKKQLDAEKKASRAAEKRDNKKTKKAKTA